MQYGLNQGNIEGLEKARFVINLLIEKNKHMPNVYEIALIEAIEDINKYIEILRGKFNV